MWRFFVSGLAAVTLYGCSTLAAAEPTAAPPTATATLASTATPAPISTPVALPTPTPEPTLAPEIAFAEWMKGEGYEFVTDVTDGSKRYRVRKDTGIDAYIDLYTDSVLSHADSYDDREFAHALTYVTNSSIAAIKAYGLDSQPIYAMIESGYSFPLVIQSPGYVFEIKTVIYGVRAQVTFVHP